jgi:2,3,4,5-tetrahydropyridine-2-carboxylate N-succinyltransferase
VSPERLAAVIDAAWDNVKSIGSGTRGPVRDAVDEALAGLDSGSFRVAEKIDGTWVTHQWLKKAVLLSFRLNDSVMIPGGPGGSSWYDKVRPKFQGWDENRFRESGIRVLPDAQVRYPAYIAPGAVLLPSFVNVGARVEGGTMIDTWATVGSCAQIGKNCHISGGAGIGGVLEPVQAGPVVIEDDVFIGARAEVAEGVIVETGSVLSMGVYIGASTRIIDRTTGEVHMGRVPSYSVVVSGTQPSKPLPNGEPGPGLYCAVIVKKADAKTRSKTSINELLRDEVHAHNVANK